MVWQEVTALLRRNIAVNSLGVPDLKSILEHIVRVDANNLMCQRKYEWRVAINCIIIWTYKTNNWNI